MQIRNTQTVKKQPPPKPKRNSIQKVTEKSTKTTESKKSSPQHYNWNVNFPQTQIHQNSILYRDAAQNASYRKKLQLMSEKIMMMGGRGKLLGNTFGGSSKDLSPRKTVKNATLLYDNKHAKSELSLNQIKDVKSKSTTLLNMIAMPFNWKSRMLMSRHETKKSEKSSNLLTNFWRKIRVGNEPQCNIR